MRSSLDQVEDLFLWENAIEQPFVCKRLYVHESAQKLVHTIKDLLIIIRYCIKRSSLDTICLRTKDCSIERVELFKRIWKLDSLFFYLGIESWIILQLSLLNPSKWWSFTMTKKYSNLISALIYRLSYNECTFSPMQLKLQVLCRDSQTMFFSYKLFGFVFLLYWILSRDSWWDAIQFPLEDRNQTDSRRF